MRVLAVVGLVALASCGWRADRSTVAGPPVTTAPLPTTTTTVVPAPTTTTAAPTTTTAAPQPVPAVIATRTGVLLPVVGPAGQPGQFTVSTPCSATAVAEGTPVGPVTVVLDPGHGGRESGAVAASGLAEKTVNLAVARQAEQALARSHITTVLTRTADYGMTLDARAKLVQALHPKAFVSIHHNSEPDGPHDGPGTETYYQIASTDSKRLAGLVYEEVVKALAPYDLPWVGDTDAGAKYRPNSHGDDYYAVLRQTHGVPSALAELAFISDPPEADLISRPDGQQVEGEAVARGIIRYLTTRDPGSGYTIPYPRTEPAGGGGGPEGCLEPPLT